MISRLSRRYFSSGALGLGFLTLALQVVLIRRLVEVFLGNELTIGIALACWLLGSASGASLLYVLLKRYRIQLVVGWFIFPVVLTSYFFILLSSRIFGLIPGVMPSLLNIININLFAIFPAALLTGAAFPWMVEKTKFGNSNSENIAQIYVQESIGAFVAALGLSLILFRFLIGLQIILLSLLIFYLLISVRIKRNSGLHPEKHAMIFVPLSLLLLLGASQIERMVSEISYSPWTLKENRDTPYGNVKIAALENQTTVFYQGKVGYTIPGRSSAEAKILFPVLPHGSPEKILIAGGNLSEFLPYLNNVWPVKKLFFLEMDPVLISMQKIYIDSLPFTPPFEIDFETSDLREFLIHTGELFDVICMNRPDPATLELNRLYSRQFFSLVKSRLKKGGIFYFQLSSSENYFSRELSRYLNLISNTLAVSFRNVLITPGDPAHILASDRELKDIIHSNWESGLAKYEIEPDYLTPYYIKYQLSRERINNLQAQLDQWPAEQTNSDFNLKGYLFYFKFWSSIFNKNIQAAAEKMARLKYLIIAFMMFFLLILHLFVKRNSIQLRSLFNMFIVGGISIALEIIILLEYQVLFGTLYSAMALLFGCFMLGLALGARGNLKIRQDPAGADKNLIVPFLVIIAFLFVPIVFEMIVFTDYLIYSLVKWLIFPGITLLLGILNGRYFLEMTGRYFNNGNSKNPGYTYASDLAGAVIGSFLVSVVLVPSMGIEPVLALIGGILLILLI